ALLGAAAGAAGVAVARRRLEAGSFVSRRRLLDALEPRASEMLLEVRPASGHYSLAVAELLWPGGRLDLLGRSLGEVEPLVARAREEGFDNVFAAACEDGFPFHDGAFDGA